MPRDVQVRVTKAQIASVIEALTNADCLDDGELKLDMLEGETDLNNLVRAMLNDNEQDEGVIAALDVQIEDRRIRKARYEARVEARRNALIELMQAADLPKLVLPEATLSTRALKSKLKIVDPDLLPDEYRIPTFKPDMEKLKEAFEAEKWVPGTVSTNGGVSITIRRK